MRNRVLLNLCAGMILLAVAGCVGQRLGSVRVGPAPYICRAAFGPITLDGRIDEAAWRGADVLTNFYVHGLGATNPLATAARMLWDRENLYVAITCADTDVWSYSTRRDDELWYGDIGELFLKPDRDKLVYYEFGVAPNGALYDARYPSRGAGGFYRFKIWSSEIRTAVVVGGTDGDLSDTDEGFSIEMVIPLSTFQGSTLPADGVTWTFGVFRYDYSKLFEHRLLLGSVPPASRNGFHYYEGYTEMIFKN